jgi:hypothetical protein
LQRALTAIEEFCRRHRHDPIKLQHAALTTRLQGHFNYFGVNGNSRSMATLVFFRGTALVQMVESSKSTQASQLDAVQGPAQGLPASTPLDSSANLGCGSMRLVSGGAGWWKSPSPDLRGLRVGNCPGLPARPISTSIPELSLPSGRKETVHLTGLRRIQA